MMRRREFRLQTILSYKEKLVELLQMELGALERARQQEQGHLQRLYEEQDDQMDKLQQRQSAPKLDTDGIDVSLGYLRNLQREIQRQSHAVEAATRRVDEKRRQLLTRTQEKKVLEKLRTRHMAAYQRELTLAETKATDEAVSNQLGQGRLLSQRT